MVWSDGGDDAMMLQLIVALCGWLAGWCIVAEGVVQTNTVKRKNTGSQHIIIHTLTQHSTHSGQEEEEVEDENGGRIWVG